MFMCTLDETPDRLRHHREHKKDLHGGVQPDGCGKHKRKSTVITEPDRDRIRQHIRSFPAFESHYC